MIRDLLKDNIVEVTFRKTNGEKRILTGTLLPHLLPTKTTTSTKSLNEEVVRVYDLENEGWRSFREDSVINFRVLEQPE